MSMSHKIARSGYLFAVSYTGSLDYDVHAGTRNGYWQVDATTLKGKGFFDAGAVTAPFIADLERAIDARLDLILTHHR